MAPITPIQLEHLYIAYQLLAQARAAPPVVVLMAHVPVVGLENRFQEELTEHFLGHQGLDEAQARESAMAVHVKDIAVALPVTVDTLRLLLAHGVLLDGDAALIRLGNGEVLPVTLSREMQVRAGLGSMWNLVLANESDTLGAYFEHPSEV